MEVYELMRERRSIRRFAEKPVPFSALKKCVNAARLSPSARNVQELEFVAVSDRAKASDLNQAARFGGAVREKGRKEGEEAKAFIVIIAEKERFDEKYTPINAGIAAEAITLAALGEGVSSCIMGAIERERIKGILGIPNNYKVLLAIAVGYAAEKPRLETREKLGEAYWVGKDGELHVPKLPLEKVLHKNGF